MTEAELAEYYRTHPAEARRAGITAAPVPCAPPASHASHTTGVMNKTEALYVDVLKARKLAEEIRDYHFEGLTFRLADRCRYTPDFVVVRASDRIECHEVKACAKDGTILMRDDALVKLKVAAEMYPWIRWRLAARLKDGTWKYREFRRETQGE